MERYHPGEYVGGVICAMLGFGRPVSLLFVAGGGLWFVGYATLMSNSPGLADVAFYGMVCGALLVGVAAAQLFSGVTRSPSLRIIGLVALVLTAMTTGFAIVLLEIVGDVDEAWGVIDAEWLMGWGQAGFMGMMALVSLAASRTARSWVEIMGWAAAIFGGAGQTIWFLAYVYLPRAFGSGSVVGDLLPVPIVLFGLAWIWIGLARLQSSRTQNRLEPVHQV
jgi:hypothetical protein